MQSLNRMAEEFSSELARLKKEHLGHEERLAELRQKKRLSTDEELEIRTLKKLKLRLKDRMAALQRMSS